MEALWAEIKEHGAIALPQLDGHRYGDVLLEARGRAPAGSPLGYRYEFGAGALTAARAFGPGTDHRFAATATDGVRCEYVDGVSLIEAIREICEGTGGAGRAPVDYVR